MNSMTILDSFTNMYDFTRQKMMELFHYSVHEVDYLQLLDFIRNQVIQILIYLKNTCVHIFTLVSPIVVKMVTYMFREFKKTIITGTLIIIVLIYIISKNNNKRKIQEKELNECFIELTQLMTSKDCYPILLRLAWSDAATYDQSIKIWPQCGGTNGSIRFDKEINHINNNGLSKALQYLRPLRKKYPHISWADMIQMSGALAVELCGGPKLQDHMIYGRIDAPIPSKTSKNNTLQIQSPSSSSSSASTTLNNRDVRRESQEYSANSSYSTMYSPRNSTASYTDKRLSSTTPSSTRPYTTNLSSQTVPPKSTPISSYNSNSTTKNTNMNTIAPPHKLHRHMSNSNLLIEETEASRLPVAEPPYPDGVPTADAHIRHTFYRMGFKNKEIVALCGAHTIGRAFKDRSGVCEYASGDMHATMYTKQNSIAKAGNRSGIGMPGGCSWTKNWLQFDNSYFRRAIDPYTYSATTPTNTVAAAALTGSLSSSHQLNGMHNILSHPPSYSTLSQHGTGVGGGSTGPSGYHATSPLTASSGTLSVMSDKNEHNPELLWLPTDNALLTCSEFRPHFLKYAKDQNAFFEDYLAAHIKMSQLGAKFDPPEGIKLPPIDISKYINN